MSTFGEGQVRKFFIAGASTDAGVATIDLLSEGEVQAFASDGTKATANTVEFIIASKKDGVIYTSEVIDKTKKIKATQANNTTKLQKYVATYTGAPVAGEYVSVVLFIDNYGANQGSAQPFPFHAGYVIQTGDTVTSVATGLKNSITQVANNMSIDITATNAAGVLTVNVNRTPFSLGKFDGKPIVTKGSFRTKNSGTSVAVVESTTASNNGIEIANIEWFDLGNTGDIYRGIGFPNNFEGSYKVTSTAQYKTYDLSYYSERISAPGDKQRAQIIVAAEDANDGQIKTSLGLILGVTYA